MSDVNAVPDTTATAADATATTPAAATPATPVEILQVGFDANGLGQFVVGLPHLEAGLYLLPAGMTSQYALRYTLVNGVVTDAYPGQSDADAIAAVQAAADAAVEAANAAAVAAATSAAAAAPLNVSRVAMMDLFLLSELEAIYTAAKTTVLVQIWLDKLQAAQYVDLHDPQTIAGINALVAANLLTAGRAAQILSNTAAPVGA